MDKIKTEYIYLLLSLIVGVLFIYLTPAFEPPDEDSHFKKAYMVSKLDFYVHDNGTSLGNNFPSNLQDYIDSKFSFGGDLNKKNTYHEFTMDNQTLTFSENTRFQNYSTSMINPIIYTVPALGMISSKIITSIIGLKITIPSLVYGARLMSLIVYSFVVFYAIKISPKYKNTIAAIALMPMSLSLFSSITYDNLLISFSLLLLGIVLKYRYDDKVKAISKIDYLLIGIILFIYINVKYIYTLNILMLLLIPKEKFGIDKKERIKNLLFVLVGVGIIYLITNGRNFFINTAKYDLEGVFKKEQIKFVLNNPFEYINIYYRTLVQNRFYYISTFIGVFGLIDTNLPTFIYILYIFFLILTLLIDGSDVHQIKGSIRLVSLIIPIAIISLAFLALYIEWTSIIGGYGVGAQSITGVQGRYFIPAIVMMVFAFANKFKLNIIKKNYNFIFISVIIITLASSILMLLLRYWI